MTGSRAEKWVFGGTAALVFAFLYLPLVPDRALRVQQDHDQLVALPRLLDALVREARRTTRRQGRGWLSVKIALFSTAFALLLGTSMAFAFARHRFFGREIVNFVVILPIILPGVITGVALASFFLFTDTDLSIRTVIIGHTTFCIVLVFNNVLARLRRVSPVARGGLARPRRVRASRPSAT